MWMFDDVQRCTKTSFSAILPPGNDKIK